MVEPGKKIRWVITAMVMACLAVCFPGRLDAQMTEGLNKDSLRRILIVHPADTDKVVLLIKLGQQYENNQPDSAICLYRQAGSLSEQLHYPAGIVQYINNYTAVLNMQGHFDESLRLNRQAVDICRRNGLNKLYLKALVNVGVVYQYKEDYLAAADYYLQALPLLETTGDSLSLSQFYGNLCGLYRNLHQPDKALAYARQSLKLAESKKEEAAVGMACNNMANALKDAGDIQAGIRYLQRAYAIGRLLHDSNMQETALINLGDAYNKLNDPGKYIPAFQSALPLARAIGDISGQAFALQGIAQGFFWKKQYTAAEHLLLTAIPFARDHDQKEVWRNLLLLMSDVQIALGRPMASRNYRNKFDSVGDALLNAGLIKNIQELETKYAVEKKQHELLKKDLELEEKDKKALRQRGYLIAAMAGAMLLSLLLVLTLRFNRQKQQLQLRTIEALQSGQENLRLKATLDGQQQERQRISQEMHDDMGSGLTSLLFLSRTLDHQSAAGPKIQRMAEQLVRKMNEIIWTMNHEQDTLDSLITYIRVNAAEALEHAGIGYSFEVGEPIEAIGLTQEFRRNIYLAVKEAVHNAVRHSGAGHVHMAIAVTARGEGMTTGHEMRIAGESIDGDVPANRQMLTMAPANRQPILTIEISDDGKGFDPGTENRLGNGMKNMQRRIEQINGVFEISKAATGRTGTSLHILAPLPAV